MNLATFQTSLVLGLVLTANSPALLSQSLGGGTVSGVFNLRFENVEQDDNALKGRRRVDPELQTFLHNENCKWIFSAG